MDKQVPELPEVETIRKGLQKQLPGRAIESISVLRPESLAYPNKEKFIRLLKGKTFKSINRRGKYLLMDLSDGLGMIVHLRMSGRLLFMKNKDAEPPHTRVRILLSGGYKLIFDDTRVFGRLWCKPAKERFEDLAPSLALLGPEPTGQLSAEHLRMSFQNKKQAIKTALLDQSIIAGVGNIYADESLFLAKIAPEREAGSLSFAELKRLTRVIEEVIANAIELGGSTLRDYTNSDGINGNYQEESLVYGRKNEPCRICKTKIERIKLAGRSAHFCPNCQH